MPDQPTKEEWQEHAALAAQYATDIAAYAEVYEQGGENPTRPLPPKPPKFTGWSNEEED